MPAFRPVPARGLAVIVVRDAASPTSAADRGARAPERAPRAIGRLAVRALLDELAIYPKPGLVSSVDSGSHDDMDAASFVRSAFSLRAYFRAVAALGRDDASFAALRGAGQLAEARMLRATGGVNTHRGAIFTLGLLAAAAGLRGAGGQPLGGVVRQRWSDELRRHHRDPSSHGHAALARHGAGGALAQAIAGFPTVFDITLPALRQALAAGASRHDAGVHACFVAMAHLDDTNLLHRGGPAALAHVRGLAAGFLARGSVFVGDWKAHAVAVHRELCARRLSPGGAADLLAAALFVHALDG